MISRPSAPAHRWWAIGLALSSVAEIAGCSSSATPQATSSGAPVQPLVSSTIDAAALYAKDCALCHGPDGIAVPETHAPNLNSQGLLAVADDQFLHRSIRLGRPGIDGRGHPGTKMPVFGRMFRGPLSEDEIDALVTFIRAWQTVPSVTLEPYTATGDAAAGATTYAANCAECHGADGWGPDAPRLADDTFQKVASDAFIRYTVLNGRPDTQMAAFDLSDAEVGDLIVFIRSLADRPAPP